MVRNFLNYLRDFFLAFSRGIRILPRLRWPGGVRLIRALSFRERILLLVFTVLAIASLSAMLRGWYVRLTIPVPTAGGTYIEGVVGEVHFINPVLAPSFPIDADLTELVFAGLLRFTPAGGLQPVLAESLPEVSQDGKTYTVRIRDGAKFHDGQQVTSEDVAFTIQMLQHPTVASPLRSMWIRVKAEVVDERTIRFILREQDSTFPVSLVTGILPAHIWQNIPAEQFAFHERNREAIGAGPYVMQSLTRDRNGKIRALEFAPFSDYALGAPRIAKLMIRAYDSFEQVLLAAQKGEIAGFGFISFDFRPTPTARKRTQVARAPLPQYQAVLFNLAKAGTAVSEKAVRQALALAVDRQSIIQEVYRGQADPLAGPAPRYQTQVPTQDVARAQQLLEEAGWRLDAAGGIRKKGDTVLSWTLSAPDFPLHVQTAEHLKRQWEAIGVQVTLEVLPPNRLTEDRIKPRSFDALLASEYLGPTQSLLPLWHSSSIKEPGFNFGAFSHAALDRALDELKSTSDEARRAQLFGQINQIFAEEVPAVFLVSHVYLYNVPKKLQGVVIEILPQTSARFAGVHEWYLKTKRIWKR
jgi:peptide/nickel transport system substrate-binding protein